MMQLKEVVKKIAGDVTEEIIDNRDQKIAYSKV